MFNAYLNLFGFGTFCLQVTWCWVSWFFKCNWFIAVCRFEYMWVRERWKFSWLITIARSVAELFIIWSCVWYELQVRVLLTLCLSHSVHYADPIDSGIRDCYGITSDWFIFVFVIALLERRVGWSFLHFLLILYLMLQIGLKWCKLGCVKPCC